MAIALKVLVLWITVMLAPCDASFLHTGFNSWLHQSSVVVENWLYVSGGEVWFKNSTAAPYRELVNYTLSIDLSKPWNTSNVQATVTPLFNGNNMLARRPMLWYEPRNNVVTWFGGWPYFSGIMPSTWTFEPNGNGAAGWQINNTGGIGHTAAWSKTFSGVTSPAFSLWVASPNSLFSLGGIMTNTTDPVLSGLSSEPPLTGLLTYSATDFTWTNLTLDHYQEGWGVLGAGIYVPIFGRAGILVFLGGDAPPTQEWHLGQSPVSMSEISLYSIHSGSMYRQTASGAVPPPRSAFCAVSAGSSAPANDATWEIFVFGGWNGGTLEQNQAARMGMIYILTLPAFEWIVVPSNETVIRNFHNCQLIGKRQMFSIGGLVENNITKSDLWDKGLGIFDLTDLKWKFDYDPDAPAYVKSQPVKDVYAVSRFPPAWNDPFVKSMFNASVGGNASSTLAEFQPPDATNTSVTAPGVKQKNRDQKSAAIAGAVVGSTVFITIIATIMFIIRKRRTKALHDAKTAHFKSSPDSSAQASTLTPGWPIEVDSGLLPEAGGEEVVGEMENGMKPEMPEAHGVSELDAVEKNIWDTLRGQGAISMREV